MERARVMYCYHNLFAVESCGEADFITSLFSLLAGLFSAEVRGCQGGMNRIRWRCVLIGDRCWCEQWRFWGERPRSAATRRHTCGICEVMQTEYLEKRACFMVKMTNKWHVFQCSVNWARARPKTTLIAGGVAASRGS